VELEKVRKKGYAVTKGQRTLGTVGLAAPIWGSNGRPVGGLVINLPEQRFDSSKESVLGKLLIQHARRVTLQIGGSLGDGAVQSA
jgi:DNA-binding IclR family transcriptional regulator